MHPLHRALRDRHCCPTHAGPVPFLKIAPRCPCRQGGAPVPFLNRMTFSKSAILHTFPNFYILRVDIFRMFFIRSSLRMTPISHEAIKTFYGNRSFFPKIRNADTQTDRQTDAAALYIKILSRYGMASHLYYIYCRV